MKKLGVSLAVLFLSLNAWADFKIFGGLNQSRFREEGVDWKPRMGLVGGLGIEFNLTYRTLIELDLLYFQKGGVIERLDSKEKFILASGSVPILIRSKFLYGTSPFIVGGVEIAGVLSYKARQEGGEAIDLEETIHRLDYGIVAGAGFEIELQEELFLFFELRGHFGMRNLIISPLDEQNRKTTAVVLLIGVRS